MKSCAFGRLKELTPLESGANISDWFSIVRNFREVPFYKPSTPRHVRYESSTSCNGHTTVTALL